MHIKVDDFVEVMKNIAPNFLKEEYDNVGLMVGNSEETITNILVALDCTLDVVDEAIEKKCNLIFTHHPLLFIKPRSITNETIKGKKIIKLIKNDISLFSAHTNLDSVFRGINDCAAEIIGYDRIEIMDRSNVEGYKDNSGIGRMLHFEEGISLKDLCIKIKKVYNADDLRFSGDESKIIHRVALINGSGQDYFGLSKKYNADCIITGDTSYHYVSDFTEEGIAIIDAGHFNTEWPAFKLVGKNIESELRRKGFKGSVIYSETCKNPYKTL